MVWTNGSAGGYTSTAPTKTAWRHWGGNTTSRSWWTTKGWH